MTEGAMPAELLAAVAADRDDDAAALVLADWLADQGRAAEAERIYAGCRAAADPDDLEAAAAAMATLPDLEHAPWAANQEVRGIVHYRRGLVEGARLYRTNQEALDGLAAWAPLIRTVVVHSPPDLDLSAFGHLEQAPDLDDPSTHPRASSLRQVGPYPDLEALERICPEIEQLEVYEDALESLGSFRHLRRLDFEAFFDALDLGQLAVLTRLEDLRLRWICWPDTPLDLRPLSALPALRALRLRVKEEDGHVPQTAALPQLKALCTDLFGPWCGELLGEHLRLLRATIIEPYSTRELRTVLGRASRLNTLNLRVEEQSLDDELLHALLASAATLEALALHPARQRLEAPPPTMPRLRTLVLGFCVDSHGLGQPESRTLPPAWITWIADSGIRDLQLDHYAVRGDELRTLLGGPVRRLRLEWIDLDDDAWDAIIESRLEALEVRNCVGPYLERLDELANMATLRYVSLWGFEVPPDRCALLEAGGRILRPARRRLDARLTEMPGEYYGQLTATPRYGSVIRIHNPWADDDDT